MSRFLVLILLLHFSLWGIDFTFSQGCDGWKGDFTDYPINEESFYELAWGWDNLPLNVKDPNGDLLNKGLFLSGNNHSDDLFMFVKRKIENLEPNTPYSLSFSVLIESNVPEKSFGIGGSPGESVFLKVGGSTVEPEKIVQRGYYLLNVDKGNQAQSGENALVIGTLANPSVDPEDPHFFPKVLESPYPLTVQSDSTGSLWIFVGTDSGFEGATLFYIAQVTLKLNLL